MVNTSKRDRAVSSKDEAEHREERGVSETLAEKGANTRLTIRVNTQTHTRSIKIYKLALKSGRKRPHRLAFL